MKNLSNPLEIAVRGNLIGKIWMPARYARMNFNIDVVKERERFTEGLTIKEAVERYLSYNTGDFQYASIAEGVIVISYRVGNRTVSKHWDLSKFPCLADSMANEKEMEEYEAIEF